MTPYRTNILMILVVLSHQLVAQVQSATIQTTYEFIDNKMKYHIEVNGVDVSASNETYTIPTNKIGFDTIEFSFHDNPKTMAIMKLRHNQIYELSSNLCSRYEIRPQDGARQGMVQFRIDSKDSTKYLVGVDGLNERAINREVIDEFYYAPPSAMCPFSVRTIQIQSLAREVVHEVKYHFLHGELLGVEYDQEDDSIELNLYGHIRDESDYRYLYSYEEKE